MIFAFQDLPWFWVAALETFMLSHPVMTLPSALMSAVLHLSNADDAILQTGWGDDGCDGISGAWAAEVAAVSPCGQPQEHCGLLLVCEVCSGAPTNRCRPNSCAVHLPHGMVHVWSGGEQGRRGVGKPVPQGATIALACIPICCIVQPHNQISGPAGLCAPAGACLSDKQRTHCL
jgi:hypothetical protein